MKFKLNKLCKAGFLGIWLSIALAISPLGAGMDNNEAASGNGAAATAGAMPVISGLSGSIVHNQSVTIAGSGFGAKAQAAPLKWDNFESYAVNTHPNGTGWYTPVTGGVEAPLVVNDQPRGRGTNSVKHDYATDGQYGQYLSWVGLDETSPRTKLYVSYYKYMTMNMSGSFPRSQKSCFASGQPDDWAPISGGVNTGTHLEHTYLGSVNGSGPLDEILHTYVCGNLMESNVTGQSLTFGNGTKTLIVEADMEYETGQIIKIIESVNDIQYMQGPIQYYNQSTGELVINSTYTNSVGTYSSWHVQAARSGTIYFTRYQPFEEWNRLEYMWDTGTRGHADGSVYYWVDGDLKASKENEVWWGIGCLYNMNHFLFNSYLARDCFNGTGWSTCNPPVQAYIWTDDVYIDNTLARVELCNESVWDASGKKHCEIQIPSAWSDNSITTTVNQGSFTNGQTAYLYVVDANGNVNANGYPIIIGAVNSGDLNNDQKVSIADIQLCIKVILNQLDPIKDADIIQKAKELAAPYDAATIKDIQEIIKIILSP